MKRNSIFTEVVTPKVKYSKFDLSHSNKLTLNMGELVPILCEEVLPGDHFRIRAEVMFRFAPLVAPIYHNINAFVHWFFVPNRLVWNQSRKDSWEAFIATRKDDTKAPVMPFADFGTIPASGDTPLQEAYPLLDYMGVNLAKNMGTSVAEHQQFNVLPFRAYQLIYNEYYRDQNLEDDLFDDDNVDFIPLNGGDQSSNAPFLFALRRRAWEHDYFTSALPTPQQGAAVPIPVSLSGLPSASGYVDIPQLAVHGTIPVTNSGTEGDQVVYGKDDVGRGLLKIKDVNGNYVQVNVANAGTAGLTAGYGSRALVEGLDLSGIELSGTMEDLRTAEKLQEFLEIMMRGGRRYIETILSFFGVRGKDATLQRPQYLGGGMQPIQISEVAQTSESTETSPQGSLAGRAVSVGASNGIALKADEHGWLIGILSVMPRTGYMQGLDRKFTRFDRLDYFWPQFEHLGEQAILNKEVYNDPSDGENDSVFGYIPRYAEYKFHNDEVHGDFKGNLDFWHLARKFDERPYLNNTFIKANPSERIFAVEDNGATGKIWANIYINESAVRPMSYFGSPRW